MLEIVRAESAPDVAAKIEARLLRDLAGVRLSIPARVDKPTLTDATVQAALRAAGWKIDAAAAALNVSPRTLYRWLEPKRKQLRAAVQAGAYNGRLVR